MGIIECQDYIPPMQVDTFMTDLLRSRISRRVIAEQHLSFSETFQPRRQFQNGTNTTTNAIGEVLLHCNAREVVSRILFFYCSLSRQRE